MYSQTTPDDFPRIETERLSLREIVPADADRIFSIFSDPEAMRYWSCRPYISLQQAHDLIENMGADRRSGTAVHWGITWRGDDRLIGKCGYNHWDARHRRGDISYIIGREEWGKGVVSEALRGVVHYGFEHLNLHSIEAGVTPGNDGSTRLLERLGFRLEGHLRENFWAEDRFVDSLIYSLLNREWRNGGAKRGQATLGGGSGAMPS